MSAGSCSRWRRSAAKPEPACCRREEIREAFKQYFEGAEMGEEAEPSRLYELKSELEAADVVYVEEVDRFCAVYFQLKEKQSISDHQRMNAALDCAVDRFCAWWKSAEESKQEAELWRGKQEAFLNLYAFLSQIIPYQDSDLEKLSTYLRYLAAKLPRRTSDTSYAFDDDVRLKYYRLQKISEGSIDLKEGTGQALDGPSETGTGLVREERVRLSRLITLINERFGTDFTEADQLFFDQIIEEASKNEMLSQAANANPAEKFALVFGGHVETLMVERMEQNEEIFARYMSDANLRKVVNEWMAREVYSRLQQFLQTREAEKPGYGSEAPTTDRG